MDNDTTGVGVSIEVFKEDAGAYYWKLIANMPEVGRVDFAHSMMRFESVEQCTENVEVFMDLMKGLVEDHEEQMAEYDAACEL